MGKAPLPPIEVGWKGLHFKKNLKRQFLASMKNFRCRDFHSVIIKTVNALFQPLTTWKGSICMRREWKGYT